MNDMNQTGTAREQSKRIALQALAIIGIVALLALGTWGTVQIVRTGPSVVSNITAAVSNFSARFFSAGTPELRITLEGYSVQNDTGFDFTWSVKDAPAQASYALVYECSDGLSFLTPNSIGGNTRISCGETYAFQTASNKLTLIPISLDNRFLDSGVKLLLVEGERVIAEDEVLLTVVNERVSMSGGNVGSGAITPRPTTPPTTPLTPAPQPTYYEPVYTTVTVPRTSDPNGYVDFAVEIIRVGTLEDRSSIFTSNDATLNRNDRGGVMFVVRNLGTKTSSEWSFEAELPTRPSFTYRKADQPALAPGDRIEYTLGFDRISRNDSDEIVITIDPRNTINESNENNNRAEAIVAIEN